MRKIAKNLPELLKRAEALLIFKAIAIVAATLIFFRQDLSIIFSDAIGGETTSYMLAVPFLLVYLIFRKRKMVKATTQLSDDKSAKYLPTIIGILALITAILLYLSGSYTFNSLGYHMIALPIFVTGLILILFNLNTLYQLAFPIIFLVFLIPPPSELLLSVGAALSAFSATASNAIVNLLGIPAFITNTYDSPAIVLTTADGTTLPFIVDVACSGMYSLMGLIVFITFVAFITRDALWKKLSLGIIGIPLIYALNIARITLILLIGYYQGEQLALEIFHLLGGWVLIFLGTLLLLLFSEKVLKTKLFSRNEHCKDCGQQIQRNNNFCLTCGRIFKLPHNRNLRGDIFKVVAIIACLVMLTSLQAPVFALTRGPPEVIINTQSGQILKEILPDIQGYYLYFDHRDTEFEKALRQDLAVQYYYYPTEELNDWIWVQIEIAPSLWSLHDWEACLVKYPEVFNYSQKAEQIELKDIQLPKNPQVTARFFVFRNIGDRCPVGLRDKLQAVLYWKESATLNFNGTSKFEHIKLSLVMFPDSIDELPNIENQLITMADQVVSYWQPIKTWSPVAIVLSQNGAQLAAATGALLLATTILYGIDTRKQRKINKIVYNKLSETNKQIIDIIKKTGKTTTPTLENIANVYHETTGQLVDKPQLLQRLTELENTGVIKSHITNKQDEPLQTWKTQI